MTDTVAQIKECFPIARMVAPYTGGLTAPRATAYGQYFNGYCPFCQQGQKQPKQPKRFWVNIDKGICNCFHPACAAPLPMDVINFWARLWGVSNQAALTDLCRMMEALRVTK